MAEFHYQARSANKELISGLIEADSESQAAQSLLGRQLIPVKITLAKASGGASGASQPTEGKGWFQPKPDPLDALLFSQQMSTLLRSGVPIIRALGGIQESAPNPLFGQVVRSIRENLDSGRPLSACLAKHPLYFDPYYINMIRVGESSGKLDEVFSKLHEQLEFSRVMREQVKGATRYPIIVVGVMLAALGVINFFVIPAFAKIYSGFKAELPIFTRLLIGTSSFLLDYWWLMAVLGVGAIVAWKIWLGTTEGRLIWDRWKLKIPIAGTILHKAAMSRFCRSLALSLEAGLPIASALSLVSDTSDNAWITHRLDGIKTQIERGESLHRASLQAQVFTPIALQMILVGEESGALERLLKDVSHLYQTQVEYDLKTLGSQIEPFLILFLGVLVLILALGVFLPIWDLGSAALKK